MNQEVMTRPENAALIEQVVVGGDLSKLTAAQRVSYYRQVCDSVGINPLTKPFAYLTLQGKTILYAQRDATDQLRRINGISVKIVGRDTVEGVYIVTAQATNKEGRTDESTGAVSVGGLKGEALANALMKAETKAKRRVTLSICGLGWADESEVSSIPDARTVNIDPETGEIKEPPKQSERIAAPKTNGDKPKAKMLPKVWVDHAIANQIDVCTDRDMLTAWQRANMAALDKLSADHPEEYSRIEGALNQKRAALPPLEEQGTLLAGG